MATAPYLYVQPRQIYKDVLNQKSAEEGRFHGIEFRIPIDLSGFTFPRGAIFSRCVFCESVKFVGAHFRGTARFYKCEFRKEADFTWAMIEPNEQGGIGAIYNAEGNFSWSRFEAPVNFYGAHFAGPVFFWRTVFRDFAKLESRFDADVTFEGNPAFVSLEALDFNDPNMFYDLHKANLLSQDQDDPFCANLALVTDADLRKRLQDAGWGTVRIELAKSVFARCFGAMFSEKGASFQGASFNSPDKVKFSNVDLKRCRLANSNVGKVQFQNVQWDRQRTFLWASGRSAVCDERTAASVEEWRALGRLYCDLRTTFEGNGPLQEASDFHYGELEAQRRSLPRPLRYVSLLAFYRYLSAYGERPGLALCWLFAAALIFFPLLYLLAGWGHHPIAAVVHSLKTLVFREESAAGFPTANDTLSVLAKVVAWAERGIVSGMMCLLAQATYRKLARK